MKLSFKKIFKISIVLMLVAGFSGALIVLVNKLTAPIIEENSNRQEKEALEEIFSGCDFEKLKENESETISKVTVAKKNGEVEGYVYLVSGKNAYVEQVIY